MEKQKKKKGASTKKRGRGSKYEQMRVAQKLKMIEGWARHGSTLAEIAEMLSISEATLYRWKGHYPEFSEALRAGAREANGEILNSAFKQATGYKELVSEVVKLRKPVFADEDGKTVMLDGKGNAVLEDVEKIVEYEKYFEPDARMTQFMLINRLKEDYRQKVDAPEDPESHKVIFEFAAPGGNSSVQ